MGRDGVIEFVIAWAIAEGRKMAAGIDKYLQAIGEVGDWLFELVERCLPLFLCCNGTSAEDSPLRGSSSSSISVIKLPRSWDC